MSKSNASHLQPIYPISAIEHAIRLEIIHSISSMTVDLVWRSLPLSTKELSLSRVLRCGQTFRWNNVNSVWSFSTQDRIILLKQDDNNLHYAYVLAENSKDRKGQESTLAFITDYFNLDVKLADLYEQWAQVEKKYTPGKRASFSGFPGIRMLRQDPWETVVLFICSSNNNVKRISKMCHSLCQEYGTFINEHDGVDYYSFPQPEVLAKPEVEDRLRELGFGYRAKYIQRTASMFMDNETYPHITLESLWDLRSRTSEESHQYLIQLCGVGPKVADCISLMALDNHDVVPVDTHVLQIAVRDYKFKGPKTMNKNAYNQVKQHLGDLFGEYAGWAQLVMFAADLSDLNNGINQVGGQTIKHEVIDTVKGEVKNVETKHVETKHVEVKAEPVDQVATVSGKRKINTCMSVKKIKTEA